MASVFELVLFTALAVVTGAFGLHFIWVRHRLPIRQRTKLTAIDPSSGPKDRAAAYESCDAFIPMPDHLKAREEMVAWIVGEMPKLTAELIKGKH